MAHPESLRNSLSGLAQIERRTMEGSRLIRDNLNSVFAELRPLVQQHHDPAQPPPRITLSSWIQARSTATANPAANTTPPSSSRGDMESFVINLESMENEVVEAGTSVNLEATGAGSGSEGQSISLPVTPNIPAPTMAPAPSPETNNNNLHNESVADLFNMSPETASFVNLIKKYLPFLIIILAKAAYDYCPAIILFLGLYGTFVFYNRRLKAQIALHSQRSVLFLLFGVAQLTITIFFFYYLYYEMKLYLCLVLIPPYIQPLSVTDLLWLVAVNDFILKLITIIVKILITLIPLSWFETKKRGKWYLAIECWSQLYRSLMPIQPWLYYLLESYQGPQKVVGVFLSAAYMISKGADLLSRARAWWSAMVKLRQNVEGPHPSRTCGNESSVKLCVDPVIPSTSTGAEMSLPLASEKFDSRQIQMLLEKQVGVSPDKESLSSAGVTCPICHDDYTTPVLLTCRHIFCETCVTRWFDREQTCPLCRAKVVDDPSWRDGSTTYFAQLF